MLLCVSSSITRSWLWTFNLSSFQMSCQDAWPALTFDDIHTTTWLKVICTICTWGHAGFSLRHNALYVSVRRGKIWRKPSMAESSRYATNSFDWNDLSISRKSLIRKQRCVKPGWAKIWSSCHRSVPFKSCAFSLPRLDCGCRRFDGQNGSTRPVFSHLNYESSSFLLCPMFCNRIWV